MGDWTIRDYARIIFRQKAVIIITCIIFTGIVIIGLMLRTPVYEAEVKMLVTAENEVEAPYYKELLQGPNSDQSLTQIEVVTSNPVLERVVSTLHLYDKPYDYESSFASPLKAALVKIQAKMYEARMERVPPLQRRMLNFRKAVEELRHSIKVEPVRDTNVFIIHDYDFDRFGAAIIANLVSRSYVIFDLQQQLAELELKYGPKHPLVVQLRDTIDDMVKNLSGRPLPTDQSIGPASVKIIEQASVPLQPMGQPRSLIAIVGFFISIILGLVLAFIFEYMDQTIKSAREAENTLQTPLLGGIPLIRRKSKMLINNPHLPTAYKIGFVNLANQISLLMSHQNFKSLLVSACDTRQGGSTVAINLALALSEHNGKRVILLEANLRQSSLHKILNLPQGPGLADILDGSKSLDDCLKPGPGGVTILTAGKTQLNPLTLLDSVEMRRVLDELKAHFDSVIVDAAQSNIYRETLAVASMTDKTLLVLMENRTRRQVAIKILDNFKAIKVEVLGTVLNGRTYPVPRFVYNRI